MNRKEFFQIVRKWLDELDEDEMDQIQWAYWLAKNAHRIQKRDSNERYFEHCRRVAILFTKRWAKVIGEYHIDYHLNIVIALLHDIIEDCFLPPRFLEKLFGQDVVDAIELLSKCKIVVDSRSGKIRKLWKGDEKYYGAIRKSNDIGIQVQVIKCFDRLDNIRDFKGWTKKRQQKYIAETEKYILPIAKRTDKTLYRLLLEEIAKIKKKVGE